MPKPVRVRLELLEERFVPAGNVAVDYSNGHLALYGDSANNSVEIALGAANTVVVRGLDGTRINGRLSAPFVVTARNGLGSLEINMNGGDDSAVLTGLQVRRNFDYDGGRGKDVLTLRRVDISAGVNISSDNGDDTVNLENVRIGGDLFIDTGSGNDSVSLRNSTVNGKTIIQTVEGNDTVRLIGNTLRRTEVYLGVGADDLSMEGNTFNGRSVFYGEEGHDRVTAGVRHLNTFTGHPVIDSFAETLEPVGSTHSA